MTRFNHTSDEDLSLANQNLRYEAGRMFVYFKVRK